jgi:pseudouridine synthase
VGRLHKVIAASGLCSRRAAERLIAEGRVEVNGRRVVRPGTRVDPGKDAIRVDGRRLAAPAGSLYLALNKPRGYVTTLSDPEGRPTVADLLRGVGPRVYPVGRLDYHSEGLLLVTNDGALARALAHPSSHVPKTYLAKVRGHLGPEALRRLSRGVPLGERPARAEAVRVVKAGDNNAWVEITVVEGRQHVVRRMFQAVGHPVLRLRRLAVGAIRLGRLAPGAWRPLTPREVEQLRGTPAPVIH